MPGSIGNNRGIAVEGASSEASLRTVATPGGVTEQNQLMAEFSHLLDQIAVEVEKVSDVKTFLRTDRPVSKAPDEKRPSRFEHSSIEFEHSSIEKVSHSAEEVPSDLSNQRTENAVDENARETATAVEEAVKTETQAKQASVVTNENQAPSSEDATGEQGGVHEYISEVVQEEANEVIQDEVQIVSLTTNSSAVQIDEMSAQQEVVIPLSAQETVPVQVVAETAGVQKSIALQDGMQEKSAPESLREDSAPMTGVLQSDFTQKVATKEESRGSVALSEMFQKVSGEEAQAVHEVTSALQKVVSHQQMQQNQPREEDQLARIVEGLLQGTTTESGTPQQPVAAPGFKQQSEVFSSLVQSRIITGSGGMTRGLEQGSTFLNSGAQQGNNQAFSHQAQGHVLVSGRKGVDVEKTMSKEGLKELSKGQELRTLKKVEEALKEVAKSRDGKSISLRLDPPSLGSVRVEVSIREGILHARLAADSAHVNTLLRDKGSELQQMLRGLGVDVSSVNVSVQDEGEQSHQGDNTFTQQEEQFERGTREDGGLSSPGAASVIADRKNSSISDHWVA